MPLPTSWAVLGIVTFVFVLLIVRLFVRQGSSMSDEREWFATALRYEFSARVDSVQMFKQNNNVI